MIRSLHTAYDADGRAFSGPDASRLRLYVAKRNALLHSIATALALMGNAPTPPPAPLPRPSPDHAQAVRGLILGLTAAVVALGALGLAVPGPDDRAVVLVSLAWVLALGGAAIFLLDDGPRRRPRRAC